MGNSFTFSCEADLAEAVRDYAAREGLDSAASVIRLALRQFFSALNPDEQGVERDNQSSREAYAATKQWVITEVVSFLGDLKKTMEFSLTQRVAERESGRSREAGLRELLAEARARIHEDHCEPSAHCPACAEIGAALEAR